MPDPARLSGPHGALDGVIRLPASKSISNRALIAAALAGGGRISGLLDCLDTRALVDSLRRMGWEIGWVGEDLHLGGRRVPSEAVSLNLGDSGTGARLILGLAAAVEGEFLIDGSARLRERPMLPLIRALRDLGAHVECSDGFLPIRVRGRSLSGGEVRIEPESSSQFVSALLMMAPLLENGLRLQVDGEIPSAPYLLLTQRVMAEFGADIQVGDDLRRWVVAPGGLRVAEFQVESDWSAAAFPLAAVALSGGRLRISSLDPGSVQGDRKILRILGEAGLEFSFMDKTLEASGPIRRRLRADLLDCPDLFPALIALAACGSGDSEFSGLEHLRHKESNRLESMCRNLEGLGARFELGGGRLRVCRRLKQISGRLRPVMAFNDHRIAMAMAVVALYAGPLEIDHPECVNKSFPSFWEDWDQMLKIHPEL